MEEKDIENKIFEVLADVLNIDYKKITLNSHLVEDLGMDSFKAIELVFALEDIFKIDIPESDLNNVKIVSDILKYIKSKLQI